MRVILEHHMHGPEEQMTPYGKSNIIITHALFIVFLAVISNLMYAK